MPREDAEGGTGVATVVDRPGAKGEATVVLPDGPVVDPAALPDVARVMQPSDDVQTVADMPSALHDGVDVHEVATAATPSDKLRAQRNQRAAAAKRPGTAPTVNELPLDVANQTLSTTAADALHEEAIDRTRLFIRVGWAISAGAIAIVPLLPSPVPMQIAMVVAMLFGI